MTGEQTGRRSFLGRLLAGTVVAMLGTAFAAALAYLFPSREVTSALGPRRRRVGRADEIALYEGMLALVDDEPVWVVHGPQGFVALSAFCTHKGCVIRWESQRRLFRCPCHNGAFDGRGNVISGMPLSALPRRRVVVVDGDVYVTSDRRLGA
jgi:cytochrome b6-f complex iron-sulfur subunit